MAFDAGMLYGIVWELNNRLTDGKVEKIIQPARDEVNLLFHRYGKTERLCIRGGSNMPRLSLTAEAKESPSVPPMFCMLLRKHLGGARFLRAEQPGYERIVRLAFSAFDDMGYPTEKYLLAEIMGKYSNLMLLDGTDKILAAMRVVDFSTSRVRQVLPGMTYEAPPAQDKTPPLTETEEHFLMSVSAADPDTPADRYLSSTYLGTSVQVARQLVWNATGRTDTSLGAIPPAVFWRTFDAWFTAVREKRFTPTLAVGADGAPVDFSYAPITYFGAAATLHTYPDFASMLDGCFGKREKSDRIRQRAADLLGILDRVTTRLHRKLDIQAEELHDAMEGEKWQRMGDLITANLWRLRRGDTVLVTEDYYEEPPRLTEVPLDSRLSPAANAQKYYKHYTKAKHARENLTAQMEKSRAELVYLDSVQSFLDRAEAENDLLEIREELYRAGYAARMKGYAPPKQMKVRPMEFTSPGGYCVLVGRNNMQNDALTFHTAGKNDLWFHAKGVPGSHVILICDGGEPPAEDYTFAATLAARYSSVSGDSVPVDYTRVKAVKKPPAAKPGYVTYQTNYTAFVSTSDAPDNTVAREK